MKTGKCLEQFGHQPLTHFTGPKVRGQKAKKVGNGRAGMLFFVFSCFLYFGELSQTILFYIPLISFDHCLRLV